MTISLFVHYFFAEMGEVMMLFEEEKVEFHRDGRKETNPRPQRVSLEKYTFLD